MTTLPRQLESLSYQDLERIERQILDLKAKRYSEAATRFNQKTEKARATLHAMAKDLGMELAIPTAPTVAAPAAKPVNGKKPVKPAAKAKPKTKAGAVRFRDPANKQNTWTGRGPAPGWVVAYEKTGKNRSEFAVA